MSPDSPFRGSGSGADCEGLWPAKLRHPVQDIECDQHLGLYVDTIENEVAVADTAHPTRIYLIGRDGRVVYNPGIGPFGFSPDHFETAIKRYLSAKSSRDEA